MYIPEAFRVDDAPTLAAFIEAHPFATLVTPLGDAPPAISHVPLELEVEVARGAAGPGVLLGHVARANPHWQHFADARPSVAIFHGPHAFVSPAWYRERPAVPTWNYAVVHAHGSPRAIADAARVGAILDRLVERNEGMRDDPWLNDLPAGYRERLTRAIVAFEMPIDRIEGKFKLGQNRSRADREGTLAGLEREGATSPDARALAAFTRRALPFDPSDPGTDE